MVVGAFVPARLYEVTGDVLDNAGHAKSRRHCPKPDLTSAVVVL